MIDARAIGIFNNPEPHQSNLEYLAEMAAEAVDALYQDYITNPGAVFDAADVIKFDAELCQLVATAGKQKLTTLERLKLADLFVIAVQSSIWKMAEKEIKS